MTTLQFTVSEGDTSTALGSGDVPVLATPRVLAWMEAATVLAAENRIDEAATSVGTDVAVRHRRAAAVGAQVEVEVVTMTGLGSKLSFEVVAREVKPGPPGAGPTAVEVASGRIVRAVVDRSTFLNRL